MCAYVCVCEKELCVLCACKCVCVCVCESFACICVCMQVMAVQLLKLLEIADLYNRHHDTYISIHFHFIADVTLIIPRVHNKRREESVERTYRPGMKCSESNVISAHSHVLQGFK